jgi:hypothetical protein
MQFAEQKSRNIVRSSMYPAEHWAVYQLFIEIRPFMLINDVKFVFGPEFCWRKKLYFLLRSFVQNMTLTNGCFVSQCRRTLRTRIVEAVLTIVYSFALCSLELNTIALLLVVADWVETKPPPFNLNSEEKKGQISQKYTRITC